MSMNSHGKLPKKKKESKIGNQDKSPNCMLHIRDLSKAERLNSIIDLTYQVKAPKFTTKATANTRTDRYTVEAGNFNIPFLVFDRSMNQIK